jgi:hypothetical protein
MTTKITADQIRTLRDEAIAAGDYRQADLCDLALAPHETSDSQGGDLIGPDGQPWTRSEAAEECARVIADAAAHDD